MYKVVAARGVENLDEWQHGDYKETKSERRDERPFFFIFFFPRREKIVRRTKTLFFFQAHTP